MNPNIGIRNSQGLKRVSARTRGLVAAMAAAGLLTLAEPALASLPQGHEVRAGQVVPEVVGKTMTIRQTSQAAKLDWKRFDIGQDHAVRIEQPNREAFLVNRVTGTMQSQIDGQLSATGKVYLVNPNGVVFGAGAQVDVGGLVAAGVGLADEQMAGTGEPVLTSQGATGDIEHSGLITVREGGVARLVGKEVNLRVGSRVRAPGADVLLEADAARFSGGSVHMEMGAEVHAFGGKVQIHSGHDLTLGHIRTHDLEIDGSDRRGSYRAKQKTYDGTRRGEVEAGKILGITFTEDSTLALAFEFERLGPGREYLWPRVEFREWLGRAEVRGGVTRDLPEHAGATIQLDERGKIAAVEGERVEVKHTGTTSANTGEVAIYGGDRQLIDGMIEAKGRGQIEFSGTGPGWHLKGEVFPGASLLLSDAVFIVDELPRAGALPSERLSQWLNGGTDVKIRRTGENIYAYGDIEAKPDASGRLIFSTDGCLNLTRIVRVPRLTIQTPVHAAFDARDKDFDGATHAEVDDLKLDGLGVSSSNLRMIRSFDFDSPDPGERRVFAKVFLTGYHGDEKHELRGIRLPADAGPTR